MADGEIDLTAHDAPTVVFHVLVVDRDPVVRRLVEARLDAHSEVQVVATVESTEAALDTVRTTDVDLVVLDDTLAGEQAAPMLKRIDPDLKIVLFSVDAHTNREDGTVDAFVAKRHLELLLPTVRLLLGRGSGAVAQGDDGRVNVVTRNPPQA